MRGILFSLDSAIAGFLLALTMIVIVHTASGIMDTLSTYTYTISLKKSAEHALNMLLFSKLPFRCLYGENNIPVPLCIWEVSDYSDIIWQNRSVNCSVGPPGAIATDVATIMGCQTGPPPNDVNNLVTMPFSVCIASDKTDDAIRNCQYQELNLYVWT